MANSKRKGMMETVKEKNKQKASVPVAYSGKGKANPMPKVRSTKTGVLLCNTEPIYFGAYQLAASGSARAKRGWFIGPGKTATFSGGITTGLFWASNIGQNYQMYRFKKAVLHFRPRVPTSFGGLHSLGVLYDSEDYNVWLGSASYNLVNQAGTSVSGPFWESLSLSVDVSRIHARVPWFLFDAQVDASTEIPRGNQAVGAFFCWETSPDTVNSDTYLGDWYLEYEVEFAHPTPAGFQPVSGFAARTELGPTYPPGREDPLPSLPPPRPPTKPEPQNEAEELEY
jgi:hypothetical protein